MTLFKSWLMSMTIIGIISSIAVSLTEKTAGTSVVKAVVSLCMIVSLIYPLRNFHFSVAEFDFPTYETIEIEEKMENLKVNETKRQLSGYVESYAQTLGVPCNADVICKLSDENQLSISGIEISCEDSSYLAQEKIKEKFSSEFGIEESVIIFNGG